MTFAVSCVIFLAVIAGWAWRVERRGKQHREQIDAWFRSNVPEDEWPESVKDG